MSPTTRQSLRAGARAGIPFAVAGLVLAASFGVLAGPIIGVVAAVVMSALVFAGSAQFASVAILGGGGGALAAIVAGLLLNMRYLPMGIALAPSLRGGPARRAGAGLLMIDASWAMAVRPDGRMDPAFMIGATLPSLPCWIAGTAIGALVGDAIGDPATYGIDVIFPTFFLALLMSGEGSAPGSLVAALLGAAIALALLPFAPPGVPIIVAAAAALIGLRDRGREAIGGADPGRGPEPLEAPR
ncbi:branched-chain amino acid permease [Thermoleophilia bacterium SCSIO 60948]|nr:branched-chain amino acid permease [Thermoleophilia bacterium SCSIO 60948]